MGGRTYILRLGDEISTFRGTPFIFPYLGGERGLYYAVKSGLSGKSPGLSGWPPR